jgi:hypothetical protein
LFMRELLRTSAGVIRITNTTPLQFPERQKGPVERDAPFGHKKVPQARSLPPPASQRRQNQYANVMVAVGET